MESLEAPLECAARKGNRRLTLNLVRAAARSGLALHEAVLGGHEEIANDLLGGGVSVAARNAWGGTPLHFASQLRTLEMVPLLMLKEVRMRGYV